MIDNEILLKLGISAILGLIIGLERELKRKPLGLKTSLVISITSCLLTIVSIQSAYSFPKSHQVPIGMDPLRLAAQIVSGIGFLGAGVILKKGNDNITGLTTSAMIWGAGGIGIAVGAGFYFEAIAGVILLMISVEILPSILRIIGIKQLRQKDIQIKIIVQEKESIDRVIVNLEAMQIVLEGIRIRDLQEKGHLIELKALVGFQKPISEIYNEISNLKEVTSTDIEI
ncbi:MgtC/SapB transporter [Heyndrickxia shackletonii]|uniref:MgtC/SapB transporter n=1 Tax=Heyndrickxia shackletonii TaxID=157838 RepID=A0A0Q3X145_9BACI|nr:MgtC/SapB family protein [Heyndrickxia shackletonii]KQL55399.1 MgtC/SapB transporter [Heyndrickxia shackletonii]NEZ00583.1 MgtC/SapB family protein [Heyndrickxia shackletonii]